MAVPDRRRRVVQFLACMLLLAIVVRVVSAPRMEAFDPVLAILAKQRSFTIVQIGAYIGDTPNDPLFPFLNTRLKGQVRVESSMMKVVLVEPIKEYFDLLRKNYGDSPLISFENVAIAATEGTLEMYRLTVDPVKHGYPEWLAQLSSLKKERMEAIWDLYEKNPEYKKFYLENRSVEVVQCTSLRQLLKKHGIRQLDLLQVDAEGFDFEVLKTLDFETIKPRFINYERVLLEEEEAACRRMLSHHGYILMNWDRDTLCIREDCLDDYSAATYRWYDPAAWRTSVLAYPGVAMASSFAVMLVILFRRRVLRWLSPPAAV